MLMINDILEMSRLDAGRVKLSLEVVDVGDVVGIVRATVGPLAAKEHLEFTSEVAPDVRSCRAISTSSSTCYRICAATR